MEEWRNGGMEEWRNGGMEEWRNGQPSLPLVVDVDGALVKTSLLAEGMAQMLRESPCTLLILPFGWETLKRKVAQVCPLTPSTLPLDDRIIQEINNGAGTREVWLVSGADASAVAPLAEHIQATGFIAAEGGRPLTDLNKSSMVVNRFGEGGYDYVGNSPQPLSLWRHARHVIGVGLPAGSMARLRKMDPTARFLPRCGHGWGDYLQALRPRHWLKNCLVFTPVIAAHEVRAAPYLVTFGLFVALAACVSGTYIFNDLCDLPQDRRRPGTRGRPMAAGKVSLFLVTLMGALLMAGGLLAAFALSVASGLWVMLYLVGTISYSLWIKRLIFADVVLLCLLHTMRILAGAAAVSIAPSGWFLGFSIFAFLALALVKRQTQLGNGKDSRTTLPAHRSYLVEDRSVFSALGAAAGFTAVVILMLFIQSPEVAIKYGRPEFLWLLSPILIYWFGRMTLLANRGMIGEDPLVFVTRDRASWFSGIAFLSVFAAAAPR